MRALTRIGRVAASLFLVSCAQSVRPDAMSARRHLEQAALEIETANVHIDSYDPRAAAQMPPQSSDLLGAPVANRMLGYNPTAWHLREASRHAEHAREHEQAAASLVAFEEAECGAIPPKDRGGCPFFGPIRAVEIIDDGVRLRIEPGTPMDAIVAQVRCHLAFARTHHFEIPSCPLMLTGVEAHSVDGSTMTLQSRDRKTVRELQKRALASIGGEAL